MSTVAAVVVTFNRRALLNECLDALDRSSLKPGFTVVVDNASTDGTSDSLIREGRLAERRIDLLELDSNRGGAGGFSAGLARAISSGADWVWMMDDDAAPHPTALEELMKVAIDTSNVYGSVAVCGDETSWVTTVLAPAIGEVTLADEVPVSGRVQFLPFLGYLIHRDLIAKIGLPDEGFFIAADDVEYCLRVQKLGGEIVIAGKSRIEHPKSRPYKTRVLGRTLTCLALPPWKRYYDTRNRILIARRHFGIRLLTQTIPGSFVRLFATLKSEPDRVRQIHAFVAGMTDGLLGLKGLRHSKWGIK